MPLYAYECHDCGEKFELLIGKTVPDASPVCPKCGSDKCERVFSTFATSAGKSSSKTSGSSSCGSGRFT